MTMPTVDNTSTVPISVKQSPAKQGIVSSLLNLLNSHPSIHIFGLAGLIVVAEAVLSGIGKPIPSDFSTALYVTLGGGAGVAMQKGTGTGTGTGATNV